MGQSVHIPSLLQQAPSNGTHSYSSVADFSAPEWNFLKEFPMQITIMWPLPRLEGVCPGALKNTELGSWWLKLSEV